MDQLLIGRVKFPALTVDVIQRGEALAIFERDLIIHFQQTSRAATLYIRASLGGIKRTLEIYRRVDETTKSYPWSVPTTEEMACPCGRCLNGGGNHFESSCRSMEKCQTVESSS